jgi:hypothetical protein
LNLYDKREMGTETAIGWRVFHDTEAIVVI